MAGNGAVPTVDDMQTEGVAKAYDRWAPIYDLVFGQVFARGRSAAIEAAEKVGGRILEVGVGTGISLPQYSSRSRLVGVDLSAPMLEKARERVAQRNLRNVEQLEVMDAEHLGFADASFDVVVAQYVVTAVPNPEAALDEFLRVARPGGEIVITTRIGADGGLRGAIESLLQPVVNRLGWRTEFSWARYQTWIDRTAGVSLLEHRPLPPLGHFSLIRLRKADVA
ncbi:class I SAM-dependent methyltransferase [Methylobacterium brachythecii]|uniref:Phosphatidylethanolamine/phosphatidyl-N-methylethanolamine N-methyltransferase n=1 Tax=Methylobacterium brachythecii TaxID=1176177 RepID=A0A7W6F6A7_9HYPH|nr:methyltransferase domain-containing protein [Methylobacterium brachythecii]MBB3902133.1 phosphatidylethanolamine/phosphatidyl-N-methylethanolamine N-methyltransferase [Methylobacterium brachythecii]GLS44530.1 SAM-dependent methyltransferase [Methylobacterium brachythecii]